MKEDLNNLHMILMGSHPKGSDIIISSPAHLNPGIPVQQLHHLHVAPLAGDKKGGGAIILPPI
jgi:hypothetical protein